MGLYTTTKKTHNSTTNARKVRTVFFCVRNFGIYKYNCSLILIRGNEINIFHPK